MKTQPTLVLIMCVFMTEVKKQIRGGGGGKTSKQFMISTLTLMMSITSINEQSQMIMMAATILQTSNRECKIAYFIAVQIIL